MDYQDLRTITTYQAGARQAYMHRNLQKVCDTILRPYGITKTQWLVIGNVLDTNSQGIRISDLAEKLGTTLSFLTNAVNLLESRGILKRLDHASDVRSKLIVVEDAYVPVCQEIETTLRKGLRETIYAKINPQEFAIYMKVMGELAAVEIPTD